MAKDAEFCKIPIRAEDIREAITSYTREKSPELNGLFSSFIFMSDLFEDFLADIYNGWQQNRKIPTGIRTKGTNIDKFRFILVKRLAHVVDKLVGDAQACAIRTNLSTTTFT